MLLYADYIFSSFVLSHVFYLLGKYVETNLIHTSIKALELDGID